MGRRPDLATMILMPMSQTDFDPTEASIAWLLCARDGHEFQFATPTGKAATADERMLTGRGLGPLKRVLMARRDAVDAHNELVASAAFQKPQRYEDLRASDYEALLLHGGHAQGMRTYLESEALMRLVGDFMGAGKPVGAICHGVVLVARSQTTDGKSVLFGRKCTTLLKAQEMAAYNLTRLWLGTYYRTYPATTCQEEVTAHLREPADFLEGPRPLFRDSQSNLKPGFVVRDRNLLTARWPGDAYSFGLHFRDMVRG